MRQTPPMRSWRSLAAFLGAIAALWAAVIVFPIGGEPSTPVRAVSDVGPDCHELEPPTTTPSTTSATSSTGAPAATTTTIGEPDPIPDEPMYSVAAPEAFLFVADSLDDAVPMGRDWWKFGESSATLIVAPPGPWDVEVLDDVLGLPGVELMGDPSVQCGDSWIVPIRDEAVAALAGVDDAAIRAAAGEWDRQGIAWYGEGDDNEDGLGQLVAFMRASVSAHRHVYLAMAL